MKGRGPKTEADSDARSETGGCLKDNATLPFSHDDRLRPHDQRVRHPWARGLRALARGRRALRGGVRRLGAAGRAGPVPRVVLGRDSRVSGPLFHQVARAALESVGADVIDVGLTTTPTLQLAVEHHHAAGGLCITASHNPIEWNALKCIGPSGLFLNAAEGAAMRALVDGGIPYATWDQLGTTHFDGDAIARHLQAVLDAAVHQRRRRSAPRGFRVALRLRAAAPAARSCRTCSSCSAARCTPSTSRPTAVFRAPPEPVAENLGDLERLVKDTGAQVGFATDPDVDRLAWCRTRARRSARTTRSRSRRVSCCDTARDPS